MKLKKLYNKFNDLSPNKKLHIQDLTLFISLFLLGCFFLWFVPRGIGIPDESFYFTVPHRLLRGENLLIDEYHVSQFLSMLTYLPFRLFYKINSGTQGIVICYRYLFVFLKMISSLFLYAKIRNKGFISIPITFTFCHFFAMGVPSCSYYNLGIIFLLLTSLLFFSEKPKKFTFFASGIMFSGLVLSYPLCALIYFVFLVIVFVRHKRTKKTALSENQSTSPDPFSLRSLGEVTLGISLCAVAVLIFIFSRGGFTETILNIPNLFTDSEYVFPFLSEGSQNLFGGNFFKGLGPIGSYYYILYLIVLAVILFDRNRKLHKIQYLTFSAVLMTVSYIAIFVRMLTYEYYTFVLRFMPFLFFGLIVYILLEEKNKRLFNMWIFCLMFSILVNISSDVYYVCLQGGICANIPGVFFVCDALKELRAHGNIKSSKKYKEYFRYAKLKKICAVLLVVTLALPFASEVISLSFEGHVLAIEDYKLELEEEVSAVCTRGPLKNLKTTPSLLNKYNLILDDIDKICEKTDSPVYVFELMPWIYLYMDSAYCVYSAWFVESDLETRQMDYFRTHPEKIPEYIYLPKVDGFFRPQENAEKRLDYLQRLCDCEVTEGDIGYTVRVLQY